jgi:16S rRNA processing protein RimM
MPQEWIAIGKVVRAVGLNGWCGIETFGKGFASLTAPCSVRLGRDSDGARESVIKMIDSRPGGYQCWFEGIDDRNAAEPLQGMLIFIERQSLPGLGKNEFYQHDLKEMQLYGDTSGALLGSVQEVHNFPSMDCLEVALVKGGSVMLPFSEQAIERIDKETKRIVVRESFVEELLE